MAEAASAGGKLAVIGGRLEEGNVAVFAELFRLAGGRILVFPTASGEPEAVGEESAQLFRSYGFETEVAGLTEANAATMAHDPGLVARVGALGSVYFTGGDQSKIVAALAPGGVETPLLAAIRAAQAAGGLVAGSSAGAAMMSQPMIVGGTSIESVLHGLTDDPETPGLMMGAGLGFFPFGMVDQHFIKRGRLGRLVVAMAEAGVRRGFGIDENTALLVEDGAGRVCGEYGVMVVDLGPGPSTARRAASATSASATSTTATASSSPAASGRAPARRSAGCASARWPTAPRPARGATPSAPTRSTT